MLLFLAMIVSIGLVACDESSSSDSSSDDDSKQEEKKEEKKEPLNVKVDVDKELNFEKFDVVVKTVKAYEKDNALLADINLDWRNNASDYGDEMTFFVATLFDVKQGKQSLIEVNDAWNPENKNSSDVFFPNALGGEWGIKMTYELVDESTPIEIIFTPTTETEESETVKVDF